LSRDLHTLVSGNNCTNNGGGASQHYGINEVGTSNYNVIAGNNARPLPRIASLLVSAQSGILHSLSLDVRDFPNVSDPG
jgi:hypothetical protein